jgi:hypothetical protein
MPMRFNFANDPHLEALHPHEARDARIIHYLRESQDIGRDRILNSRDEMLAFLGRGDLVGTNQRLQVVFRELFDEVDKAQRQVAEPWRWSPDGP